jgi:Zn-dependent peptidase ImmA (M78 family)
MFERGFKTWCESYSTSTRKQLGIAASDPLDPHLLAKHLGVRVWTPHDIPKLSSADLGILLHNDGNTSSCWSAVTLVAAGKTLVILNSSHSDGRQASDLMHELSHYILEHEAHQIDVTPEGILLLSSYEKQQEEEADWLAATLLLPREALVAIKRRRLEESKAAKTYGVSLRMLRYRMAMTGVDKQFVTRAIG